MVKVSDDDFKVDQSQLKPLISKTVGSEAAILIGDTHLATPALVKDDSH